MLWELDVVDDMVCGSAVQHEVDAVGEFVGGGVDLIKILVLQEVARVAAVGGRRCAKFAGWLRRIHGG